jgi:lysophospholipase L1-like esterase
MSRAFVSSRPQLGLARIALAGAATLLAILAVEVLARAIGLRGEFGQLLPLDGVPTRTVDGVTLWADRHPRYDSEDVRRARADPDAFTILGLGDSIMYGAHQHKEDTYLEQTRRLLAARSPRTVHVLNLATPGYNTLQENAAYKEIEDQVEPDVVLVHYWTNDARQYRVVGGYVVDFGDVSADGRFVVRALPLPPRLSDFLLLHSRAYDLLTHVVLTYKRRMQPNDWTAVSRPLIEIHERARRAGARLIVLQSPSMTGEWPEPTPDGAMLRELAASQGFEVIDVSEWLRGSRSKDLTFDGSHFTAEGHRLLGERLATYLLSHDLQGAGRQPRLTGAAAHS